MNPLRPVLLVEDNSDDQTLTLRALARHKLQNPVLLASGGHDALDCLAARGRHTGTPLPALVLLDLRLPDLDGLEVLRRIRATPATAQLPVVVLTTSRETADIDAAYRCGANSYLHKPMDFARFISTVAEAARYWTQLNLAAHAPPLSAGT